jgi:tRNA (cmo5U34)-methyltransferase
MKSTVEQIRQRFDQDVERFSNLETGHSAAVDSLLCMTLIAQAAAACTPAATHLLDIGCGAGNYTLKLLELLPNLNVTLVDLSLPMLERAVQRISLVTNGEIHTHQADIRTLDLPSGSFDIILAAAVFHHLRVDEEWHNVFQKCNTTLKPGGSLWIFDMVQPTHPAIHRIMRQRYGEYLTQLRDEAYREHVFGYIEQEDTPRSLIYQLDLLRQVGFREVEVLHNNTGFAAFGALK